MHSQECKLSVVFIPIRLSLMQLSFLDTQDCSLAYLSIVCAAQVIITNWFCYCQDWFIIQDISKKGWLDFGQGTASEDKKSNLFRVSRAGIFSGFWKITDFSFHFQRVQEEVLASQLCLDYCFQEKWYLLIHICKTTK